MQTFISWMEGKDDYNNSGVPYYAKKDTPSPNQNYSYVELPKPKLSQSRKEKYLNKRFRFKPDNFLGKRHGNNIGKITYVGPENFSFLMDGSKKKEVQVVSYLDRYIDLVDE